MIFYSKTKNYINGKDIFITKTMGNIKVDSLDAGVLL